MSTADFFPTLSLAERDRRWAALRDLMSRHGLAALAVFGTQRDQWDRYVTNEGLHGIALITAADDPAHLVGRFPLGRYDAPGAAYERWVDDVRIGNPAALLAAALHERGVADGAVGIVGMSSRAVGAGAGCIPASTWQHLASAVPKAEFVDMAVEFEMLAVVKSPEERDMIRKAAQLGEDACDAFVSAAKPGAYESACVGAAVGAILAGGGSPFYSPYILERSGPSRFAWGQPEWMGMGGRPRVLRRGDTIAAEIFAFYGGFESQQQIDVALGEPIPEIRRLEEIVLDSHQRGLAALRPGITFAELCDTMHEPLHRAGVWNTGPLVQTVSPVMFNGATHVGTENDPGLAHLPALPPVVARDGDFTLVPGVAFAFEANALYEGHRVCLGGTVLLTEDGYEELNSLPNRLVVVGT
ncbi:M24 family metallopeptidase [Uniformispora flossi]|uniref:M24 family metallopeptidase n=1 Tax=Uniformispora flossi TaxID=3390723 RepID=UPI003C2BA941